MIVFISGPHDQAMELAKALRNVNIAQGKGALVILQPNGEEHTITQQIEKILDGMPLHGGADITGLKFKRDPMILLTEETYPLLDEFEDILPGFKERFGPEPVFISTTVKKTEKANKRWKIW